MQISQDYYKQLGLLLTEYRKAKCLTQSDIANKLGLNMITISRYEQGLSRIKTETLKKLCSILDVSIEKIVYIARERTVQLKENEVDNIVSTDFIRIPLYSHIDCNAPFTGEGLMGFVSISSYDLDTSLTYYALRCKDESMNNDHITYGDTMIFIKTDEWMPNDILCINADGVCLIRRVVKCKGNVALIPSNSKFNPILLNESKIKVYGVLRRLVKEF